MMVPLQYPLAYRGALPCLLVAELSDSMRDNPEEVFTLLAQPLLGCRACCVTIPAPAPA